MQRRGRAIAAALVAGAMVLAGGGVAYADDLATVVDVDDLVVENGVTYIDLGDVECGAEATYEVGLLIERNAALTSGRVYKSSSTITFSTVSATATTGDATVAASAPAPATTVLSSDWASLSAGSSATSSTSTSTITVESEVEGTKTGSVAYRASGTTTANATLVQNKSVNVRWNVLSCEEEPPADTTAPVVELTCPSEPVEIGTEAYATWVATDAGGFADGVATSGSEPLNTGTWGNDQTLTLPAGFISDKALNPSAEVSCTYDVADSVPPVVTLVCPTGPFLLGEAVADAQWSAVDPTPGSGINGTDSGSLPVDTSSVGAKTVQVPAGAVVDNAENTSLASNECSFSVVYDWDGFYRPVDGGTTVNSVKAGSAIPIKFSLSGDQGLDIFDTTLPNPKITFTTCDARVVIDAVEQTVNAGGSSLSYDAVADQYNYVWKTDKAWAGRCGTFSLKLDDGTVHTAKFYLTK